ncbi:hypothetical protein [Candidatus Nitrosotenuis aquarius]|uniref:hypothetical protein n=1 Tax=Candidatus Nitrosotenuis aquarius TaxID=1846278 RepID=UPI000C1E24EA|nr:hypothetical protein [Candidatus Nitrosotenuis aquarius]
MTRIRFYSRTSQVDEPILWDNEFPYGTVPIFIGKKAKNAMDLLASLELCGASTTTDIARYAIESHYSKGEIDGMGIHFLKRREHYYWNHIWGYVKNRRAKNGMKYHGLIKEEYVKKVDSLTENVHVYAPTLKGHLASLGYKFKDDELIKFIKNASRNSLYFAFLNHIMEKISLDFIKEIFLFPVKHMIRYQRIRFDDDYRLNFDLIASATAIRIERAIRLSWDEIYRHMPASSRIRMKANRVLLKQIDVLMQNTWFDLHANSKWLGHLIELYYPTEEQRVFYERHSDPSDKNLIYKVMREIHLAYYNGYEEKIPNKYTQKFPLPIRRNRKKTNKRSGKKHALKLKLTKYHFD